LAIAKAYFPALELTQETAQIYLLELGSLCEQVGAERLEAAIREACRRNRFFPSVGEIRDAAGLNPEMLDAAERDQAWEFLLDWIARRSRTVRYNVGYLPDTGEEVGVLMWQLPVRIEYAAKRAGGWQAIKDAHERRDHRDLGFMRKEFDEGWKLFPYSEDATDETTLHPLRGQNRDELLKGVLAVIDPKTGERRRIRKDAKLVRWSESRGAAAEADRVIREMYK